MDKKRNRKLINWLGLTGIVALLSYAAAVVFSPLAYPGYNWMDQLAALYGKCSLVSVTCVSIFISEKKISTKLFRIGVYLFAVMNWISGVGYTMFPLAESGKEIASFQEVMHMVVTVLVVLLSIISLILLIIAGFRKGGLRGTGILAAAALIMMMVGAIGQGAVPTQYFGIVERFSVFAAVGFNAVLGVYLFNQGGIP